MLTGIILFADNDSNDKLKGQQIMPHQLKQPKNERACRALCASAQADAAHQLPGGLFYLR